jgi:HK97 family phage prohead protease
MKHTMDFGLEVKNLTDEGTFEGYAATFGNVDNGGDKVLPGAFVESLAEARRTGRKIKMLREHDPREPIGVWEDMAEDARGLWGKGRLIMDVPKARETHVLLKAGALDGLSIGYRTKESEPDGPVRLLKKVDLWEVSIVTFPMNDRSKVTAVKADGAEDIIEKLRAGERLTEREFETLVKGLGLTNSQAERAARIHLKGQGEPAAAVQSGDAFLRALLGQMA